MEYATEDGRGWLVFTKVAKPDMFQNASAFLKPEILASMDVSFTRLNQITVLHFFPKNGSVGLIGNP
jgi:hypothetical protein